MADPADAPGGDKRAVVPLGDLVSLSSGDFIKAADYNAGVGSVTVVGAGGPIGTTTRSPNTSSPAVVLGRVGAAGATHFFDRPVFATDNTLIAEPTDALRPKFLYHFLRSVDWAQLRSGSSQPLINQRVVKALLVPNLEPSEQDAISRAIDTFEDLQNPVGERLLTVRRTLADLRKAVLGAACAGRLTSGWRGSSDRVGWERATLAEVCESITDGDHQAPPQVERGIPFITIAAINDGSLRIERATRFVAPSYYEELKPTRRPRRGDILYSVTGSIGIPALVDTDERFTFQRHIAILRPRPSRVLSEYLVCALGTIEFYNQGVSHATGTAQLTIPLKGLRSFSFHLPPLAEQREIVRRIDQLVTVLDGAEHRLAVASTCIDRSAPAVLAKAFRGELVAN